MVSSGSAPCELITIPISHYCEKARWALDRAGVAYVERAHLQMIHRFAVRRAGGGTTAPTLVCEDGVLADSAAILVWADEWMPAERRIYPEGEQARAEISDLESEFDRHLGPEGRRWMYNGIRGERGLVMDYGRTGAPAWERRALPFFYPLFTWGIDRFLNVTPETAERSLAKVRITFDQVGDLLSDSRQYLCGDRFTAADLTFSALAAAVLMPPEYGVPLPQPDELPPQTAAVVRELRAHPAGAHAMAMFREQRHAGRPPARA